MTEPQVWTVIAVFTTMFLGTMTVISTLFVRVVRAEVGGLRGEMVGEIGALRGELGGEIGALRGELGGLRAEMNARFEAVDARIGGLDRRMGGFEKRMDSLDGDVRALVRHTYGLDRE